MTAPTKELLKTVRTKKFLEVCYKLGLRQVNIGVCHVNVPSSLGWKTHITERMVFGKDPAKNTDWPVIWKAVEEFGISGGCGNPEQHQITESLDCGAYRFKKGVWEKLP